MRFDLFIRIMILSAIGINLCSNGFSQNRNSIWCFGDSAGIDFGNVNNPVPFITSLDTRGSCVSVANSVGQLLFYANTRATIPGNTTLIWDRTNQQMLNGNNIVGEGWYRELSIVPDPADSNQYYLFSIGVTGSSQSGLYYSKIDLSMNGGLGSVVQKNIQLLSYDMQDGLQAIKHGNGRDWWLFCHRWDINTNEFIRYLMTPWGIQGPFIQAIGDLSDGSFLTINFSKSGDIAAIVDYSGLFEIFDFDRCTGLFSVNPLYNYPFSSDSLYLDFWTCEISPNEDFLYINKSDTYTSYLFQLDLRDSVPWNTCDTLWVQDTINYCGGALELAPDDKIYFSPIWWDGINFFYPFSDSTYGIGNMYLSVINSPDSPGVTCNFQPYSFYLGGKRTYLGLPNNPNYEMAAMFGSICDSLPVGIPQSVILKPQLNVFYHSDWKIAFVNASNLIGNNYSLTITDITGKLLFTEEGQCNKSQLVRELDCSLFAPSLYFVTLQTQTVKLTRRFVKN